MLGARNRLGLTETQIQRCLSAWEILCGNESRPIDASQAHRHGSRTRFDERRGLVILGADAFSGIGPTANARMSMLACLAHELTHLERMEMGFDRPLETPDGYLDEAETSIAASFQPVLSRVDRGDLVEDARDRLIDWLAAQAL